MSRFFSASLLAVLLWLTPAKVSAFALLGPYATWQTFEIGYQLPGDIGGPVNINEGYRWTIPTMTYGFDATFLKYFGTNGVAAVESAIKMMNDIPAADAMTDDLSEFPLKTMRINNTASALGLIDLKTITASVFLEELGLAAPERYVWTLHSRFAPNPPAASYSIIQRNWDPITRNPSSYVNGELFTWIILQTYANPDAWEAVEVPVDPLANGLTSLAGYYGISGGTILGNGANLYFTPGAYYPSLTRDDAGGLRHLYGTKNYAVEPLGVDVIAGSAGGGGAIGGGSGDPPWLPVTTITIVTNTTGGTVVSNAVPRVVTALRPGIGKVNYQRVDFDSLLNTTRQPYQVTWTDRYLTNGVMRAQQVSRLITRPDIVFRAADLGTQPLVPFFFLRTIQFENDSALNTVAGGGEVVGPGVMRGPLELTFSNAGRYYVNFAAGGAGVGEDTAFLGISYGSFDGSTNQPITYPDGASVKALEALVLGGQ